ncbi:phosphoribosylglycinamide formyltransferase 1 [Campylobacter novaezeelandiae]|uniref:Phosphoribosylglycinamide formyltransferase n=1 Tax=Campylobacter novaezeelandiae TaxID=2267891 RepID=A0A4Q9JVY5_9BACT|nr:phosphoribosylglycinamide formyltransferase [Campylobacter novaezeelandiae]QWU80052.1 phosphoribosylglycinamide formyltransferase 1 [Campylobacter novaezeelandiae]TBR82374.1 phosphoribosylglycinamide formyltransferase [Campylobacter novaezeelandiae]
MHIRLAILFSGNGSNLENILKKLHKKKVKGIYFEVVLCICNNKNAFGIQRVEKYNLKSIIIDHNDYTKREEFDEVLVNEIQKSKIDLTILAGFMRILSPVFTQNIKAINLHPSLLPLFKGANAIKQSYESDMKVAGVSVHWVDESLDGGEIIAQKAFEKKNLSFKEFEDKIHILEHQILIQAIIETSEKILKENNV